MALLARLWRAPCENWLKEALWRLAYDAHPTAARMHMADAPCPCGRGGSAPGRLHHFWHCAAARAVLTEICQAVGASLAPLPPAAGAAAAAPGGTAEALEHQQRQAAAAAKGWAR